MFKRILIANRGEIAVRIIKTCRKLGIESVVYYSAADKNSLPVRMANFSICIEPPQNRNSYLHMHNIITAALVSDADAIHPGYGFLSENAEFAVMCRNNGLVFIGPRPEAIEKMGDKIYARQLMKRNGIPVIPGSDGEISTIDDALNIAEIIGYPVIVKAAAGGGGRGMRVAYTPRELAAAFDSSQAESYAAFGVKSVYIEKFFHFSRHIEFQILADSYGNVIHLGERDCSTQRRHQKLIEESPSPAINPSMRAKMGSLAVKAAKAAKYDSAGTVEFLMDQDGNVYFMEMNTRVQVEHPVTEMVTGIDIIEQQIRMACGQPLLIAQSDVAIIGHAIECRINAEDPANNFMPAPGIITNLHLPSEKGVRVDTHVYSGYNFPVYFDSLVAKLIVHGISREDAIEKMVYALDRIMIHGIDTTIPFHRNILKNRIFLDGRVYTKFVDSIPQSHDDNIDFEELNPLNILLTMSDELLEPEYY